MYKLVGPVRFHLQIWKKFVSEQSNLKDDFVNFGKLIEEGMYFDIFINIIVL